MCGLNVRRYHLPTRKRVLTQTVTTLMSQHFPVSRTMKNKFLWLRSDLAHDIFIASQPKEGLDAYAMA